MQVNRRRRAKKMGAPLLEGGLPKHFFEYVGSHLLDAQACAREYPRTFEAPSGEALGGIAPGDIVKIHWLSDEGLDARFWVTVVRTKDCMVWGVYDIHNPLAPLPFGDTLQFTTHHVCSVLKKDRKPPTC